MKRHAVLRRTLVLTLLLASLASARPFGWEDLFGMVRISDPQVSPDGRQVLIAQRQFDVTKDRSTSKLALVGGKVLTEGANGRWLPDGTILFLRRGEVFRRAQSKETSVLKLPVGIEGFEPSPDGKKLVFWASVYPGLRTLQDTRARADARAKSKATGQLYESLHVRHWDSWKDGRRTHPFVVTLGSKEPPRDLLFGQDEDASGDGSWAADSATLAFGAKPSRGEAWTTNNDVYLYRNGVVTDVTADNLASDSTPVFSPDGQTLAYLAMEHPGFESDQQRVVLYDFARKRTLSTDFSVWGLEWARDGRSLYAVAEQDARVKIFQLDAATGAVTPVVVNGANGEPRVTPSGDLVYLHSTMTQPAEVYSLKRGQLSHVNDKRVAACQMSTPEEFWVEHDEFRLHGWVLKPVGFAEGKTYPVAMLIHGGPQGAWNDTFGYRWNPQFFAGAGYGVVLVDPRGSSGYGMRFQNANRLDWGPGPYSDLMAGLDEALRLNPWMDRNRMAALGPSYGGYMINWIAGQDHPFECLVNHDGLFSTVGAGYDTDELWFPEWEFGGTPWQSREVYERNNPERFVDRWKTPMLVIHGGNDYRVTESQGISTFTALQRRGIPSQLLYFPDENHWVLKPQNSRLWHRTIKAWLDKWTTP